MLRQSVREFKTKLLDESLLKLAAKELKEELEVFGYVLIGSGCNRFTSALFFDIYIPPHIRTTQYRFGDVESLERFQLPYPHMKLHMEVAPYGDHAYVQIARLSTGFEPLTSKDNSDIGWHLTNVSHGSPCYPYWVESTFTNTDELVPTVVEGIKTFFDGRYNLDYADQLENSYLFEELLLQLKLKNELLLPDGCTCGCGEKSVSRSFFREYITSLSRDPQAIDRALSEIKKKVKK